MPPLAERVEMHLRECQGSVQCTVSVHSLEGNTPRVSFLPTSRTVRRRKKGGANSPLFPKHPLEDVSQSLQTSVIDSVTTPCLSSTVSKTNRPLEISETDCIDKKAKTQCLLGFGTIELQIPRA